MLHAAIHARWASPCLTVLPPLGFALIDHTQSTKHVSPLGFALIDQPQPTKNIMLPLDFAAGLRPDRTVHPCLTVLPIWVQGFFFTGLSESMLPPLGFALIGLPHSVPGPGLALQTRTHTFTFMPYASLSFCAALQWSSACMLSPSKAHWTVSAKGSLSGAVTAAALSHNTQFL